jgi:uncharacterized cupin superfamily protein
MKKARDGETVRPHQLLQGRDGAYTIATTYKSGVFAGNKVVFWGSEAGALKAGSYPLDEFVYVLEGDLVTVDADGTRHEFHPGDAFVIPKGWAGTWDMKTRFKKIIVTFDAATTKQGEPPGASHLTQDSIPVRRPNWRDRA